jgi:hypothetical protein
MRQRRRVSSANPMHFTTPSALAVYRRLRTIPFCRISDGIRIPPRIARSLLRDLSDLVAKDVAIRPRKCAMRLLPK